MSELESIVFVFDDDPSGAESNRSPYRMRGSASRTVRVCKGVPSKQPSEPSQFASSSMSGRRESAGSTWQRQLAKASPRFHSSCRSSRESFHCDASGLCLLSNEEIPARCSYGRRIQIVCSSASRRDCSRHTGTSLRLLPLSST
jgi:hypothetical protein